MFTYLLLLAVPGFFALSGPNRKGSASLIFVLFLFVFVLGFRYEVGPDWKQYQWIHLQLRDVPFTEVFDGSEPFSRALFWLSVNLDYEVYLTNVVAALVLVGGVVAFARTTANTWLAIVAATPYFIIVFGMSGVRQSIAAGILLLLLAQWGRRSVLFIAIGVVIASMFHTSALVGFVFVIYLIRAPFILKLLGGAMVIGLLIFIGGDAPVYESSFRYYESTYLSDPANVVSTGALFHLMFILGPCIIAFVYRKRFRSIIRSYDLLLIGLWGGIVALGFFFIQTTLSSRLTIYLYFVPMLVYPALTLAFPSRERHSLRLAVVGGHFAILLGWFTLGNHSFAYLPYKNFWFVGG